MKGALIAVAFLFTCAKQPSPPAQETKTMPVQSGPRIVLPDGFAYSVEIANTDDLRAQGLMYRDQLKPATGMIFFFAEDGVYPFWMKNTMIPLDMIWIDANKRVAHVKSDVPPCKIENCPSYDPGVPARYVLELAAGEAAKHRLKAGDPLRFEGMDDVAVR